MLDAIRDDSASHFAPLGPKAPAHEAGGAVTVQHGRLAKVATSATGWQQVDLHPALSVPVPVAAPAPVPAARPSLPGLHDHQPRPPAIIIGAGHGSPAAASTYMPVGSHASGTSSTAAARSPHHAHRSSEPLMLPHSPTMDRFMRANRPSQSGSAGSGAPHPHHAPRGTTSTSTGLSGLLPHLKISLSAPRSNDIAVHVQQQGPPSKNRKPPAQLGPARARQPPIDPEPAAFDFAPPPHDDEELDEEEEEELKVQRSSPGVNFQAHYAMLGLKSNPSAELRSWNSVLQPLPLPGLHLPDGAGSMLLPLGVLSVASASVDSAVAAKPARRNQHALRLHRLPSATTQQQHHHQHEHLRHLSLESDVHQARTPSLHSQLSSCDDNSTEHLVAVGSPSVSAGHSGRMSVLHGIRDDSSSALLIRPRNRNLLASSAAAMESSSPSGSVTQHLAGSPNSARAPGGLPRCHSLLLSHSGSLLRQMSVTGLSPLVFANGAHGAISSGSDVGSFDSPDFSATIPAGPGGAAAAQGVASAASAARTLLLRTRGQRSGRLPGLSNTMSQVAEATQAAVQAASAARATPKLQRVLARSIHYTHRRSMDTVGLPSGPSSTGAAGGGASHASGRLQHASSLLRAASIASTASGVLPRSLLHGDEDDDEDSGSFLCEGDDTGSLAAHGMSRQSTGSPAPLLRLDSSTACAAAADGSYGTATMSCEDLSEESAGGGSSGSGNGAPSLGGGSVMGGMLSPMLVGGGEAVVGRRFQPSAPRLARIPSGMTMRPDESLDSDADGGSGRPSFDSEEQQRCEHDVQLPGEAPLVTVPALPQSAAQSAASCLVNGRDSPCGVAAVSAGLLKVREPAAAHAGSRP